MTKYVLFWLVLALIVFMYLPVSLLIAELNCYTFSNLKYLDSGYISISNSSCIGYPSNYSFKINTTKLEPMPFSDILSIYSPCSNSSRLSPSLLNKSINYDLYESNIWPWTSYCLVPFGYKK